MSCCQMIGASYVGKKHVENQDRIVLRRLGLGNGENPACLVAVVDGASCSAFGAGLARWIAERHLACDPLVEQAGSDVPQALAAYVRRLHEVFVREFADVEEMLRSAASISLAVVCAGVADILWTGDSPIYWTKGRGSARCSTTQLSTSHKVGRSLTKCFCGMQPVAFDQFHVRLSPGDIVTVMSDGAIHEETMLSDLYERVGFCQDACDEILQEGLVHPRSDDVSVAACCWDPSGAAD